MRHLNDFSKKSCIIISAVCIACAVLFAGLSTIRLEDLKHQQMDNISYGMGFLNRNFNGSISNLDCIEANLRIEEMNHINDKIDFYNYFRAGSGILFLAGGIFFGVLAVRKESSGTLEGEDEI